MRRLVLLALLLAGCGAQPRPTAAPAGPSGLLFLAGRDPGTLIRVDAATGAVATFKDLRGLSGGDPPYMIAFTGGRLVTFALGRTTSYSPAVDDRRSLGEAWFFVPSATPGRVWNILLTPHSNVTFRGVREVTVDGRVTFARHEKVPGWPVGAVTEGIVLQKRRLEVWNPATGKIVRKLPATFPVAFRGSLAASCADPCHGVHLTDTATGADRVVPGEFAAFEGAFSPDGKLLALPASGRRLAIVDVAAGTVALVPGARLDKTYQRLTWASSGWIFYKAPGGKVGAWRPGEPARVLDAKVGNFIALTSD